MASDPTLVGRLRAIRERVEKAAPGPWNFDSYSTVWSAPVGQAFNALPWDASEEVFYDNEPAVCYVEPWRGDTAKGRQLHDAEFIAHAREDVPWLLDRIEALERENEALLHVVKWAVFNGDAPTISPGDLYHLVCG